MKEPIAVIQYTDGIDRIYVAYTADNMLTMIQHCEKKGFSYIVNLTKPYSIVPIQPSKPFEAHYMPLEYVDRVEVGKQPHRAFTEVIRTKQARHPPVTIEERNKAYGH
jgi:hypothetical protein